MARGEGSSDNINKDNYAANNCRVKFAVCMTDREEKAANRLLSHFAAAPEHVLYKIEVHSFIYST